MFCSEIGNIILQKKHFTKDEIKNSENKIFCFGDNDVDFYRKKNAKRLYSGGNFS